MLPRVFDLFVQSDPSTERARSGIGLGLTLAKRLVELHHGTIEARSAGKARGSEFVVRLPLAAKAVAGKAPARRAAKGDTASRARVLVVDDNADAGESMRMLLAVSGHDVRLVSEGARVVASAAEFKPDVIVLDIGLPDMDGYRVAHALRKDARTRGVYIVAVTGYGRDADREKSRAAGIDAHMTKPVDIGALMEKIAAARTVKK